MVFIGLFISFGIISILTYIDGRYFSINPIFDKQNGYNIYDFASDWANRILYSVVVPGYIAIGAIIIRLSWSFQNKKSVVPDRNNEIDRPLLDKIRPNFLGTHLQIFAWEFLSIIFYTYFSYRYQYDVFKFININYEKRLFKNGIAIHKEFPLFEYLTFSIK